MMNLSMYWLLLWSLPFLLQADIIWQAHLQKPFALNIKLNSQQLSLDDVLDVKAEFQYPSSYQLDMDSLIDQLAWSANSLDPQWSLLQLTILALPSEADMQVQHLNAKIAPLQSGLLDISFLTVTFLPKESTLSPLHVLTPIFSLQVSPTSHATEPLPSASLMPLEPQFPLELTQANRQLFIDNPKRLEEAKAFIRCYLEEHAFPWLTIVVILACGGLGWTGYLTRDRWLTHPVTSMAVVATQPQQIHHDLQLLQKNRFIEQGQIQAYYAELASILLSALQLRLGWKAKELTTAEAAQIVQDSSQLTEVQKQSIIAFLNESDQVKFAGKQVSQTEAEQAYQQLRTFIQQLLSYTIS
jgi:hypothetical protein